MKDYFRPILISNADKPKDAFFLGQGRLWFNSVERLARNQPSEMIQATDLTQEWLNRLVDPRLNLAGMDLTSPCIMGVLNVTPDSFSDGGSFDDPVSALFQAEKMVQNGADIIDVGGESTRPGAKEISTVLEIERTGQVIKTICAKTNVAVSIDTRKASVAKAAVKSGAALVNDVSGLTFDPDLAPFCAEEDLPVCVMHSQGLPEVMQDMPLYEDVVLDVYDFLETQINHLIGLGIGRNRIIADPGIGFGKTMAHNLALLNRVSLFHSLGVPLLLGVSRKGFIGKITQENVAEARVIGSVSAALTCLSQGVQIFRVHDVKETRQAFDMWQTIMFGRV
jgi:dihydropteroate synthase